MSAEKNPLKENSFNSIRELKQTYDDWASDYDNDLLNKMNYRVPQIAVNIFTKYVAPQSKVLDVGSGTGIVGMLLKKAGYTTIEALDISKGMLEVAKAKNIYQAYYLETLGTTLQLPDNTYDAMIAIGTFGPTHAPPHAFEELIRATKPNGYILFTMRENEITPRGVFRTKMNLLEQAEQWILIEESNPFKGFPTSKPDLLFKSFVYQVL